MQGRANRRTSYRTEGSLAISPMPKYAKTSRNNRAIEQEISKKKRKKGVSLGYVVFMAVAMGVVAFACAQYIKLQSDVTILTRSTARLESELLDATLSNDEEYARIMGAVDIEKIKQIAMDELGMTYPDESQVVDFAESDSDYVRQFGKIPD